MASSSSGDEEDMITGINVTPLVDVTLVLLIIFMVTAKIIVSQGMPMDLPQAATGEDVQSVFSVELTQDGKTRVDSQFVTDDESVAQLAREAKGKSKDLRAVIRADKKVEHGRVIHVLDLLKQAGVAKIAFAVAPSTNVPPIPVGTTQRPEPEAPTPAPR
jgi:biopolymer transport protein ExbD